MTCYTMCSLGLCNCLHMCLKIKFNNNNNINKKTLASPGGYTKRQGWVQLHKITSITITITLKYQLQLHHHTVILNYNYTYHVHFNYNYSSIFFTGITLLFMELWVNRFRLFSICLACCLVPTQLRNAIRLHNIATSDSISCVGQLN